MKLFSLLVISVMIFLCAISVKAQEDHKLKFKEYLEIGPDVTNVPYYKHTYGQDGDCVYFCQVKKGKVTISTANVETGEVSKERKFPLPANYDESEIITMKVENGSLYIFSSFYNRKDEKTYYFGESIDIVTGKSNGDLVKVFELPSMKKDISENMYVSDNEEYYAYVLYNHKGLEQIGSYLLVLDKEFKSIYSYENFYSDLKGFSVIKELIVSDKGEITCFVRTYPTTKAADEGENLNIDSYGMTSVKVFVPYNTYKYYVLFASEDVEPTVVPVNPPDNKFIKYATLMSFNNSCFLSGVISDITDVNYSGVFCTPIEEHGDSYDVDSYEELDEDFQKKYLSERDMELFDNAQLGKKGGIWDYHTYNNLGMCEFNDGYLIFLEQYVDFYVKTSDVLYFSTRKDYVITLYTNKAGEIQQVIKIPKLQWIIGSENSMSSYKVFNDKLYFLFTDIEPRKGFGVGTNKSTQLFLYVFDKEFNRTTYQIPFLKEFKNGFLTANEWLSDNYLLGIGTKSMTKRNMVRIDFTEYFK